MEKDYNSNKQLITWEKYHCNAVINDCIKCPKCKGKFYLHINENILVCEECNFKSTPEEMNYNCLVCKKIFKANLKIYNPLEFDIIKISIKNALLYKIPSKPDYLPCCKQATKNINHFFHKKECTGILYSGKWINNNIVVCSKCKVLSEVDKFIWTCPLCYQKFKSKNSSLNVNLNKLKINNDNSINKDLNLNNIKNTQENSNNSTKDSIQVDNIKSPDVKCNYNNNCENSNSSKSLNNNIPSENIDNNSIGENVNVTNANLNNNHSPNLVTDLQNLLKNKNIDIDIDNLKKDAKLKNLISNFDIGIENNPASHRKFTVEKNSSRSGLGKMPVIDIGSKSPIFISKPSNDLVTNNCNLNDNNVKYCSDMKNLNPNINKDQKVPINPSILNNKNPICNRSLSNPNDLFSDIMNQYKNGENNLNNYNLNNNNKNQVSSNNAISNNKVSNSKESEDLNFNGNNYDTQEDQNLNNFECEDFKVLMQIGEGSFGKIYLVEDKYKKQFSMKKIIANDETDVENFTQEYELVNKVRHKNILRIHSICRRKLDSTTHALYILMEKGVTDWEKEIKARQNKKKFYSEKDLFNVLRQLTEALAFLQIKNISHRDIKPQNVLLFQEGIFKIADFGEAKKISIIETSKQLSTLRGTELYMSPLLFNGLRTGQNDIKHNSFKSDVFSLGFCLYYAATLNIHSLYEIRREIDIFNIQMKLGRALKSRYSDYFINLLVKMLEINENRRCDFIELQAMLKDIN